MKILKTITGAHRLAGALLCAIALIPGIEARARQLPAALDAGWRPWVGCWEGASASPEDGSESLLVCFRPLEDGSGVESLTYSGGDLLGSEVLRADGRANAIADGGCEGNRTLSWSVDGRRLFLDAEMECGGEIDRRTRGVFTVLPGGRGWSEVLGVQVGSDDPILEIRSFIPASPALLIASGIPDPMAGIEMATNTARIRAGAALDAGAIAELANRSGAAVAGGVLVERGEGFDPDVDLLRTLAGNGVPGELLDLVVALSFPDRFQIAGGAPSEVPEPESARSTAMAGRPASASWPPRASGYSAWGGGYYGRPGYGFDRFYYDDFRIGYPGYGYDYGYGYGFTPFGGYRPPRFIVIQPPVVVDPTPAPPPVRVDRNGGYTQGSSGAGSSAAPAVPRTNQPAQTQAPAASAPAQAPAAGAAQQPRRAVPRED